MITSYKAGKKLGHTAIVTKEVASNVGDKVKTAGLIAIGLPIMFAACVAGVAVSAKNKIEKEAKAFSQGFNSAI